MSKKIVPGEGLLYLEHVVSETVLVTQPQNPDGRVLRVVRVGGPRRSEDGTESPVLRKVGDLVLMSPKSCVALPRGYVGADADVMCVLEDWDGEDEMKPRQVSGIVPLTDAQAKQMIESNLKVQA